MKVYAIFLKASTKYDSGDRKLNWVSKVQLYMNALFPKLISVIYFCGINEPFFTFWDIGSDLFSNFEQNVCYVYICTHTFENV